MNNWSHIIQNWLYPPTCLLCGAPGAGRRDLCAPCERSLPYLVEACPRCGESLAAAEHRLCGRCLRKPPAFDRALALCRFEEPVRHLIHGLKFQARYAHARLLGDLLAERLADLPDPPQVLVPVPLHARRYRERGFNQAAEIARELSRRLGIPVDQHCLRRVRPTTPQVGLTMKERARNVRGAFAVIRPISVEHVALVDDVITTGATANELAKALKEQGVERVDVWACARADRTVR